MKDGHDLVEYWMIKYNIHAGNTLAMLGTGVFRRTQNIKREELVAGGGGAEKRGVMGNYTRQFLKHYKNTRGEYVFYGNNDMASIHELRHTTICEGKAVFYVHASSPLRRLIDIYNQLGIILSMTDSCKGEAEEENQIQSRKNFQTHIETNVDEINRQNRIARRIQSECEMLADFFSCNVIDIFSDIYEGTVVEWDYSRENHLGTPKVVKGYWVYLEDWKRLVYVERQKGGNSEEYEELIEIGETGKYQIFLFEEEEKAHKKIIVRRSH
jgi:hypothetical protein